MHLQPPSNIPGAADVERSAASKDDVHKRTPRPDGRRIDQWQFKTAHTRTLVLGSGSLKPEFSTLVESPSTRASGPCSGHSPSASRRMAHRRAQGRLAMSEGRVALGRSRMACHEQSLAKALRRGLPALAQGTRCASMACHEQAPSGARRVAAQAGIEPATK